MKLEDDKCRKPVAAALNKLGVWLPFPNVSFLLGTDAYRGRPDGEYRATNGRVVDVEFKAAAGSLFLGNPDDPLSTEGFHASQRNWHSHISSRCGVPYYLVLYAYADKKDARKKASKSLFYVVQPEHWYAMEEMIRAVNPDKNKKTVAIASKSDRMLAYRHISLEDCWSSYRFANAESVAQYLHENAK